MKFYTTSKLSENIRETPEGFLVCLAVPIARTGEMTYGRGETPLECDESGCVIISRDAAEVFRPETIASFEGKAVTIAHPDDFVSPDNWGKLAKGILQNVRRGEGANANDLVADLLITDGVAIGLVKNGLREVSCGYEAEYVQTGLGRGIQRQIVGNHLALVDQGRAGSSYAINDHKGKGSDMKLGDRIKAIFGKAQDDALALVEKDEGGTAGAEKTTDAKSLDAVLAAVKDLAGEVKAMKAGKDEAEEKKAPKEKEAKDEEEPAVAAASLEERLAKLEAAVSKLLERESKEDEVSVDAEEGEEAEESEDDDVEEEMAEDEESEAEMVGDTAARIEILAPGLKAKGKDAKAKALKAAWATQDGKAVIGQFTDGKAPDFKDATKVNTLFVAASELLKVKRSSDFSKTKTRDFGSNLGQPKGAMTPEQINAANEKHYKNR